MSAWLGRQRKADLIALANEAGFFQYDGLRQKEIAIALDDYLRSNATRLSRRPVFREYYERSRTPMKREPDTTAAAFVLEDEITPAIRGRGRPPKAREEDDFEYV
ncbi:hypothetical protein B0A49_10252 [Cryomyces minteri]|uniref:Uncharacterized protein n=1 Tax=Cryomyces minteri TaxID=331657 RepID=A0A4U0WPM0_9PEZI|nr:hypothetical protein B0A49_10252 [Cryomyces minteri]